MAAPNLLFLSLFLKNISELNLSSEIQDRIRNLCEGRLDSEEFSSVTSWLRQCFHRPSKTELIMAACNEILEGHGVEALRGAWLDNYHQDVQAAYVNMGDCYVTTLIRDHLRGEWLVTTIGDLLEADPKRFQ